MRTLHSIIALLLLTLLIAGQSSAQVTLKPGFGLTFSDVSKSPVNGVVTSKPGWQIGGTILVGSNVYFEPGIFYATKSTLFTDRVTRSEFTNDINGFRIPVALGIHLLGAGDGMFALRVFGGGSAFIITSVNSPGLTKDDFTTPSWGIFAGAGLNVLMFYVDLQYEWSLSNVSKLSTVDIGNSRSLFANAGIRLTF